MNNIKNKKSSLDSVDERTNLVGKNRFEILLFNMGGTQRFGINVFKVKEVINNIKLSEMPGSHKDILGISNIRGESIPVVDLRAAVGLGPSKVESGKELYIVTEYNSQSQAFLVSAVDRIVNINWTDVDEPPATLGGTSYITAITRLDDQDEIIGILDVERVLSEINPLENEDISSDIIEMSKSKKLEDRKVLIVDDSAVARKQIDRAVKSLGCQTTLFCNGDEALKHLIEQVNLGKDVLDVYDVIISDIEMPVMDGYTLTKNIRSQPALAPIPIILHTSMSGVFNENLVKTIGVDKFIAKFDPDLLGKSVVDLF